MSQATQRTSHSHANARMTAIIASLFIFMLFSANNFLLAQEATEPAPIVEEVATEVPATEVVPTSAPTEAPATDVVPTEVVTDAAPTESSTIEVVPTEVVTEAATEIATETVVPEVSPTAATPLVFTLFSGAQYDNIGGIPLLFQANISSSMPGELRVIASAANGTVEASAVKGIETTAPFNTLVNVTYTANPAFSGPDTITLSATDELGQTSTAVVNVNVTVEATPEVTDQPATKEMLINYDSAASEEAIQAILVRLGATEISRIPQIGAMRVLIPETIAKPSAAITTLQSGGMTTMAGVTAIEENSQYQMFYTTTDPLTQWGLGTAEGIWASTPMTPNRIFGAWDAATTRGLGVTVAVIDGAIDLKHPDLLYQTVPGWDFVLDRLNPGTTGVKTIDNPNTDVNEELVFNHGTHIAGIIAAKANNAAGIAGVAFNAKIMPLRVCTDAGLCDMYYIAAAIVHATDKGAKVINLSLGSKTESSTLKAAIQYALSRNVVVVAAAGNVGGTQNIAKTDVVYPAAYDGVISVAAHDITGLTASLSVANAFVDVSAPGIGITSLIPTEQVVGAADYAAMDGTSMAAAHVSGMAALIIGAKVAITTDSVTDAVICGAGPDERDNTYGWGRVRAHYSLDWNGNSNACSVTLPNNAFETPKVIAAAPFTSILAIDLISATTQLTDPSFICGVERKQTLWYSFKPTVSGNYQLSTLGSSYNTAVGVYQGTAGQLNSIGCSINTQSTFSLQAAQLYYIVVGTNETEAVTDQVLQLRINAALPTNNLLYQENAVNIAYSGMWVRGVVTGSSSGYTQQTTDTGASAAFTFRGTSFDYYRTVGPDQGKVRIFVNNIELDPVDNRGAVTKAAQIKTVAIAGAASGQWNTVRIMRDAAVPGAIDIDAIKTIDFDNTVLAAPITVKVDDRSAQLRYNATNVTNWMDVTRTSTADGAGKVVVGAATGKQTTNPDAYVTFRTTGNAITIFRAMGDEFAPLLVTIDGTVYNVPSSAEERADDGPIIVRPYTIDNLVTMTHVVKIQKSGTAVDGLIAHLDAVQSLTMPVLALNTIYDDRAITALAYRGAWTDVAMVGANGGTKRILAGGSEVSFKFTGNDLCIQFERVAGVLNVYVDNAVTPVSNILALSYGSGGLFKWCLDATAEKLMSDSTHYIRLAVPNGSSFTLDYIRPQRYNVITPLRALVPETDPSFRYDSVLNWTTQTTLGKSAGGYVPQGGSIRVSSVDNTALSFYINGTGFILYTGAGSERGCWTAEIDGVVYLPTDNVNVTGIALQLVNNPDLPNQKQHIHQPLGFGLTGFAPGVHRVDLIVDANCTSVYGTPIDPNTGEPIIPSSSIVPFDGIRVFP